MGGWEGLPEEGSSEDVKESVQVTMKGRWKECSEGGPGGAKGWKRE